MTHPHGRCGGNESGKGSRKAPLKFLHRARFGSVPGCLSGSAAVAASKSQFRCIPQPAFVGWPPDIRGVRIPCSTWHDATASGDSSFVVLRKLGLMADLGAPGRRVYIGSRTEGLRVSPIIDNIIDRELPTSAPRSQCQPRCPCLVPANLPCM